MRCLDRRIVLIVILLLLIILVMFGCRPVSEDDYHLTVFSTEGGKISAPGEGTFTFSAGTEVELTATPFGENQFSHWSGHVSTVADINSASTTITMNDSYSVSAEFKRERSSFLPPEPPEWNPQKQALLPDREFDSNWTTVGNWYPALNREISAIWTSWGSKPGMIVSPKDANVSTKLGLSEGQPPGDGRRILRCIFTKDQPGGVQLDLVIKLYDGEVLLGEWVEEDIPAAWTTREYEWHLQEHNWNDLRVELVRQGDTDVSESDLRQVHVSLVEIEIPYPRELVYPYLNSATTTYSIDSDTVQSPPGATEGDLIFVCTINGEAAEGFTLIYSQSSIEDAPQPYHMKTWWKRAESNEPAFYTFSNAQGLWAARISGAGDGPIAAQGHAEPLPDGFTMPLGISTPSVDAGADNSLVLRISANSGYIAWTEPHQWIAWDEWPCCAASWRFQKDAGPTGEEYHGTGSFIHWVAQTIVITPD